MKNRLQRRDFRPTGTFFEAVSESVPAVWIEGPDAQHLDGTTDPFLRLLDEIALPDVRLFTEEPFTPLKNETLIEVWSHYSTAFFDLTLKNKRGSLGALKTGRYNNVAEDGRDVVVETKSLEVVHR